MNSMKILIKEAVYDMDDVTDMLNKLFLNIKDKTIELEPSDNVIVFTVKDGKGDKITNTTYPPNVKFKDIIGYYDMDKKLCVLPIRDKKFIIKYGCGRSKPIRPLYIDFTEGYEK